MTSASPSPQRRKPSTNPPTLPNSLNGHSGRSKSTLAQRVPQLVPPMQVATQAYVIRTSTSQHRSREPYEEHWLHAQTTRNRFAAARGLRRAIHQSADELRRDERIGEPVRQRAHL